MCLDKSTSKIPAGMKGAIGEHLGLPEVQTERRVLDLGHTGLGTTEHQLTEPEEGVARQKTGEKRWRNPCSMEKQPLQRPRTGFTQ